MQAQLSSERSIASTGAVERLAGIQVLRAVAALCVVYAHLMERNIKRGFITGDEWWMADVGHLGVCVFFAISGYVMIHASARPFAKERKSHEALLFFKRRLIRVCPLYYLTTAAFIVFEFAVWKRLPTSEDVARSLMFIPYRDDGGLYQPVYGLGWSLNYEMFFYLLMAIAILMPRPGGIAFVCAVISALLAIGIAFGIDPADYGSAAAFFYTRPELFYFLAGMFAAILPVRAAEHRFAAVPTIAPVLMLAGAVLAFRYQETEWLSALGAFLVVRTLAHHFSLVFLGMTLRRFLTFLGDASYSLYLTHTFVLGAVTIAMARLVPAPLLATALSLLLGMAIAIVTAIIAYIAIERPLTRAVSHTLDRRS